MAIKINNGPLRPSKAPNIPIAPVAYDQQYIDRLMNTLRLYFNQIDGFTQAISIPLSGPTTDRPITSAQLPLQVGQFYFDTDLGTTGLPIWWDGTQWIDASGTVV